MNLPVNNVPHQPAPSPQEIRARLDPPTRRFGAVSSLPDHPEVGGHPVGRVGPRAAATLVDALLLSVVLLAVLAPEMVWANARTDGAWWGWDRIDEAPVAFATVLVAVATWAYLALTVARWGATPGQRLVDLRVVRDGDAAEVGYGRATVRAIVLAAAPLVPAIGPWLWLALLAASVALALADPLRRTVWDRIAGTVVVDRRVSPPSNAGRVRTAHSAGDPASTADHP
jgi:uncharacterized RDD family membrane protein YckC